MVMQLYVWKKGKRYYTETGWSGDLQKAYAKNKAYWKGIGTPESEMVPVEIRELPVPVKAPAKRGKPKKAK